MCICLFAKISELAAKMEMVYFKERVSLTGLAHLYLDEVINNKHKYIYKYKAAKNIHFNNIHREWNTNEENNLMKLLGKLYLNSHTLLIRYNKVRGGRCSRFWNLCWCKSLKRVPRFSFGMMNSKVWTICKWEKTAGERRFRRIFCCWLKHDFLVCFQMLFKSQIVVPTKLKIGEFGQALPIRSNLWLSSYQRRTLELLYVSCCTNIRQITKTTVSAPLPFNKRGSGLF